MSWWERPFKKSRTSYTTFVPPVRRIARSAKVKKNMWQMAITPKWWLNHPPTYNIVKKICDGLLAFNNHESLLQRRQAWANDGEDGPEEWQFNTSEPITVMFEYAGIHQVLFTISFTEERTWTQAVKDVMDQLRHACKPFNPVHRLTNATVRQRIRRVPVRSQTRKSYKYGSYNRSYNF